MSRSRPRRRHERVAILRWTARMGAVTAEALADRQELSSRLRARSTACRRARRTALAAPTAGGAAGALHDHEAGLRGCRAARARALPGERVERAARDRLRRRSPRRSSAAIPTTACWASASCARRGPRRRGACWRAPVSAEAPAGGRSCTVPTSSCGRRLDDECLPVAVEVELTIKAPRPPRRDLPGVGALPRTWRVCSISPRPRWSGRWSGRSSGAGRRADRRGSASTRSREPPGRRHRRRESRPRRSVACARGVNRLRNGEAHVLCSRSTVSF